MFRRHCTWIACDESSLHRESSLFRQTAWDFYRTTHVTCEGVQRLKHRFAARPAVLYPDIPLTPPPPLCTYCVHHSYRGVYFGLYDTGAAKNPWKADKGIKGMVSKFGIAQLTAITAGYASYPFDTVRRRLQMQSEKPKSEWQYQGALDCLRKIIKEEGERRSIS